MAMRIRKQVYIDPAHERVLKQLAQRTGATEAEIIRQAINRHARASWLPRLDLAAWEEERAFIVGLIRQGALGGGRTWSREDLYER